MSQKNLDYKLGTLGFGNDSFDNFYVYHPNLDKSKSTNANIRPIDINSSPKYQTFLMRSLKCQSLRERSKFFSSSKTAERNI